MRTILLAVLLLVWPVVASLQVIPTSQEELQLAVRRHMQCQADNVATYNVQAQLFQAKLAQLQAELDEAKKQIETMRPKE